MTYVRAFRGRVDVRSMDKVYAHCVTGLVAEFRQADGFLGAEIWTEITSTDDLTASITLVSHWTTTSAVNAAMGTRGVWEAILDLVPYLVEDPEVTTMIATRLTPED